MKKKLLSLFVVVTLMCQMITATAFAVTHISSTPGGVADQLEQTIEYYASKTLANLSKEGVTDTNIAESYYPIYLIGTSGVKNESAEKLNTMFVKSVKALLAKDEKILSSAAAEDAFLYAGIINALTVIGQDPKDMGKDLVKLFADCFNASYFYFGYYVYVAEGQSPYDLGMLLAALNKYKTDIEHADDMIVAVLNAAKGYCCSDGKLDKKYIAKETEGSTIGTGEVFNDTFTSVMAGFKKAEGTTLAGTESNYCIDSYNYYRVSEEAKDDMVAALTAILNEDRKSETFAAEATCDGDGYFLTITARYEGKGIYYYGFSADNDAVFLSFLNGQAGLETENEVIKAALDSYVTADGTVKYDTTYGANPDSTGTALAAYATIGDMTTAAKVYAGLLTYVNKDNGAIQYYGEDNLYATKDALMGLVAYYRALTGQGSIYNLKASDLAGKDEAKYEMTKDEGATESVKWTGDKKEGLKFRSTADISKFIAVYVDNNKVDSKYITLEEGSTIVTLAPEFLATLDNGEHKVKIQSTDGYAEASFAVEVKELADVTNTGDSFNSMLIAIFALSGFAVAAVMLKKKEA